MNRYNYRDDKVDKWFEWKGVKPPERIAHMTEEELEEKLRQNFADHKCHWYQVGPDIECDASPNYTHGKRIGTNLRLDGTDSKGMPVLVKWGPILRSSV
jgi:hypothetical protein